MKALICALALACTGLAVAAQDRQVVLSAPQALVDTGLFRHILPRFKLKTQISVTLGEPAQIALVPGTGNPVLVWQGQTYSAEPREPEGHAGSFAEWLFSEVGQNTITSFGDGAFARPEPVSADAVQYSFDGDAVAGEDLAHIHCGRCHVVSARNRFGGIGSTPSFGAMKNFPDWEARFSGFFALNPHPSFTQIDGLTEPFDPSRPPHIAPVTMSFDDYEAILAFIAALPVKNLGAQVEAR